MHMQGNFRCKFIPNLIIPYAPDGSPPVEPKVNSLLMNTELNLDSPDWDATLVDGSNCDPQQRQMLREVLAEVKAVFSEKPGCTHLTTHRIRLKEAPIVDDEEQKGGCEVEPETLHSALTEILNDIPPTREEIIQAQKVDSFCRKLRNLLNTNENGQKELCKAYKKGSKYEHYTFRDWKHKLRGYILDTDENDGSKMLVFFNSTYEEELDDSGNGFKAVIPRALVKRALFTCHGHPLSGHAGRSKTPDRAKLLYYWPGMDRDTRIYVKACRHCQQYKPSQQRNVPVLTHHIT
uniref:RNA-directed DNA polymerase n=1 Tax=Strigamia maritima TaxID=126957 RepID=T1IUU1_STRMM